MYKYLVLILLILPNILYAELPDIQWNFLACRAQHKDHTDFWQCGSLSCKEDACEATCPGGYGTMCHASEDPCGNGSWNNDSQECDIPPPPPCNPYDPFRGTCAPVEDPEECNESATGETNLGVDSTGMCTSCESKLDGYCLTPPVFDQDDCDSSQSNYVGSFGGVPYCGNDPNNDCPNGTPGLFNGSYVCLPHNYGNDLPTCDVSSSVWTSDGAGFGCATANGPGYDPNGDIDGDGTPNSRDNDMDGDGVDNNEDPYPENAADSNDIDGDGKPNAVDPDIDGDGIPNDQDPTPQGSDIDGDGQIDSVDQDIDGDGVPNDFDTTPFGPDSNITVDSDQHVQDCKIGEHYFFDCNFADQQAGTCELDNIIYENCQTLDSGEEPPTADTDTDGDGVPDVNDPTPEGPDGPTNDIPPEPCVIGNTSYNNCEFEDHPDGTCTYNGAVYNNCRRAVNPTGEPTEVAGVCEGNNLCSDISKIEQHAKLSKQSLQSIEQNTLETSRGIEELNNKLNEELTTPDTLTGLPTIAETTTNFLTQLSQAPVIVAWDETPSFNQSAGCPVYTSGDILYIGVITMDIHCTIFSQHQGILSAMFILVWTLAAGTIFLRA